MEVYDIRVDKMGRAPEEVRREAAKKAVASLIQQGKTELDTQEVLAETILLTTFALACAKLSEEVGPAVYGLVNIEIIEMDEDTFPVCLVSIVVNPREDSKIILKTDLTEADVV